MEKKNKLFLITDPICRSEEHLNFNRKLLSLLKNEDVEFVWSGDMKYGEQLLGTDMLPSGDSSITYNNQYTFREAARRYLHIFSVIRTRKDIQKILFLSFDNSLFPVFTFFNMRSLRGRSLFCVIHNNLRTLQQSPLKRGLFRVLSSVVEVRYIALTESMRSISTKILKRPVFLLNHPFYDLELNHSINGCKTFLTVGRQCVQFMTGDNFETFLSVCKKYIHDSGVKVALLMGLPQGARLPDVADSLVEIKAVDGFISHDEYWQLFRAADFFIFPESEDADYRASGTLMDSLSSGTLFIAPNKGHFTEFEGCGILYEPGGLAGGIHRALHCTEQQIEQMKKKIESARASYEARNTAIVKELIQS